MISTEIAQAAISVAEEFDRRALRITAKADSPVQQLINSYSAVQTNVVVSADDQNREYEPTGALISDETGACSITSTEAGLHADLLDEMVTSISEAVSAHLNFAKNVVRPLIVELAGGINKVLESYPQSSTYNPIVVRVSLPEPLKNPALEDAIEQYRGTIYQDMNRHMNLASMSGDDIVANLKTGSGSVDKDIDAWVARIGKDFMIKVWNSVFTKELVEPVATFESLVKDPTLGVDAAAAVYLLAKRLLDAPPEGSPYTLREYRAEMGEYLNQAGLRLVQAYDKAELDQKTGLLILAYTKDVVHVNAEVYDAWLSAGANNAVLFGNLLTDRPALFVPAMDEKSSEYLTVWERQNRLQTQTLVNRRIIETKKAISFKTEELLAANLQTCYGEYSNAAQLDFHTPAVVMAMDKLDKYVQELKDEEVTDVWKLATEIVCNCIFYYTDAYKILTGIDAACKENPGIDVNEAALISLIQYVTDYVCDQLVVQDL